MVMLSCGCYALTGWPWGTEGVAEGVAEGGAVSVNPHTDAGRDDGCPPIEVIEALASGLTTDRDISQHLKTCEVCRRRVENAREDNNLLGEFFRANAPRVAGPPDPGGRDEIPGYELGEEIHRGGQGVVYQATQLATKRAVAIKMLLWGTHASARQRMRFEREVEFVAALRHPGIVTVYDSGLSEGGQHYVAMEFVEGLPLDQYMAAKRDAEPLSVRETFQLFEGICDALRYAHQRGVIHRDVKPSNIIVDPEGHPHVLDFGVAKPIGAIDPDAGSATMPGEFVGTYAYAAPEQVADDPDAVDVRTDVYALGIVLYEMLVGERPYVVAGSIRDAVRAITEAEPTPLEQFRRGIDNDAATIVLKALMKDPARRYQSAMALLADVRYYLKGEAIDAKRDSQWYVLRKTLLHNKRVVAVVTGGVLLLTAWAITAVILERQRSKVQAYSLARSSIFRQGTLSGTIGDPGRADAQGSVKGKRGSVETIPELLIRIVEIADEQAGENREVLADVLEDLVPPLAFRGQTAEAISRAQQCLRIREKLFADGHLKIGDAMYVLGLALWRDGQYAEAAGSYEGALEIRRTHLGPDHQDIAMTLQPLASTYTKLGRYNEAKRMFWESIEMQQRLGNAATDDFANTLNSLARLMRDRGAIQQAHTLYRQSLEIMNTLYGEDSKFAGIILHNLGACLIDLGELEEARTALNDALRLKEEWFRNTSPAYAKTLAEFARLALASGNIAGSLDANARAMAIQEGKLTDNHPDLANSALIRGRALHQHGDLDDALNNLTRALDMRLALYGEDHWLVAQAQCALGACLTSLGRTDEAERLLIAGCETLEARRVAGDPITLHAFDELRALYLAQGRLTDAERIRIRRGDFIAQNSDTPND